MYTKFHDRTLITQFIQTLLSGTNFPIGKTVRIGDTVVKDVQYIYNNNIVTAKQTGIIQQNDDANMFTVISPYVFGDDYPGLTTSYTTKDPNYSSECHYYLGQLLRAYRDLFDVDLMPLYNCFGGAYVNNLDFDDTGKLSIQYGDEFKYLLVPIKFNKKYTLCFNSYGPVKYRVAFVGNKGFISDLTTTLDSIFSKKTFFKSTMNEFSRPYIFNGLFMSAGDNDATNKTLVESERFLRLIIKIPTSCKTSVVVLEGEYPDTNKIILNDLDSKIPQVVCNNDPVKSFESTPIKSAAYQTLNKLWTSPLSLTKMSDGNCYPFANRLIEYLLMNVITSSEDIGENIKRIQERISSPEGKLKTGMFYSLKYIPGVWNITLRDFLYTAATKNAKGDQLYDLLGFLDKDAERIIF